MPETHGSLVPESLVVRSSWTHGGKHRPHRGFNPVDPGERQSSGYATHVRNLPRSVRDALQRGLEAAHDLLQLMILGEKRLSPGAGV